MQSTVRRIFVSAALVAAALCAMPLDAAVIEEGDVAEYSFRGALVNGMGTGSLKDLQGKPVLVEFWGSR